VEELLAKATEARSRAYAPYSGFFVGAAIEADDGRIVVGCNVENASFSLGICAERAAVTAAVSQGISGWRRIAVVAESSEPVAPCGACRQVLSEFCDELEIILADSNGVRLVTKLSELLPRPFGAEQLGGDEQQVGP